MQNVNLSKDEHFNENWILREVYQQSPMSNASEELTFLIPPIVNSEEELYYKGNTAVYSTGLCDAVNEKASSETCYTSEGLIKFAFFCTKNFLDADYKIDVKPVKRSDAEEVQGIGIFDTSFFKVFASNGENLVTAIEAPISNIWITKYCVIMEKEASTTMMVGHSFPMPRVFSLGHLLDDMFPVLIKSNLLVNYITEADYKVSEKSYQFLAFYFIGIQFILPYF